MPEPSRPAPFRVPPSQSLSYTIDADDRFASVDHHWDASITGAEAGRLARANLLGKSLWDMITDQTTGNLYQALVGRVRSGVGPVRLRFRCDGPDFRRMIALNITRLPAGHVGFDSTPLVVEHREPVRLLDSAFPRSGELLTMCSWCNRLDQAEAGWVEVEAAMRRLRLDDVATLPRLTHSICPTCLPPTLAAISDPDLTLSDGFQLGGMPPS